MCYLNLTIKTKKPTKNELEKLEEVLAEKATINSDGFATLFDNKTLIRTCDPALYCAQFSDHLYNSAWGWFITHYRQGTSGEKGDKNIHLWKKDGFTFAHNGFANGLGEKPNHGACDSLLFFNKFLEQLGGKTDRGHIIGSLKKLENKFWGRAILVDPAGLVWLLGDFTCYKTKSLIVVSSSEIDLADNISYGALKFTANGVLTAALDGLYVFDGEIFKKENSYIGSYSTGFDYTSPYKSNGRQIGFDRFNY